MLMMGVLGAGTVMVVLDVLYTVVVCRCVVYSNRCVMDHVECVVYCIAIGVLWVM